MQLPTVRTVRPLRSWRGDCRFSASLRGDLSPGAVRAALVANDSALAGPRRDYLLSRRWASALRALHHRLCLWRLAVPHRLRLRAAQEAARYDDPDRAGDLGRLFLLRGRHLRFPRSEEHTSELQ